MSLRELNISLRGRLAAFTFVVCLAIVAVFAANSLHARAVAVEVARNSTENLAQSLASQASDTFEAVDGTLLTIAQRVQSEGMAAATRVRLRDAMAASVTKMPRLGGLTVFDARGRSVVSNISATAGWTSVRDRAFFQYHRTHSGSVVHISGPEQSEAQPISVIFVSRRIERPDGSFAGVAVAEINVSFFQQSYAAVNVGRAGTISLFADDGLVMVRQPRSFIGRRVPNAGLFTDPYKYQAAGTYVRASVFDGVRRFFSFRRLDQYPLAIQVALSEREYLAEWWADTVRTVIALTVVIGSIAAFARALGVQMGRRKEAEDALARLALLDGLTGIPNRRQFDAALERAYRTAARDEAALALLMIDVDDFKAYNDAYGHQRGDEVLVSIALAVGAALVRPGDLAARYGGEEFVAILPATSVQSAALVAEHVRLAVIALGVPHVGTPGGIASVSIGVAGLVPTPESDCSALVRAADAALYDAKRAGRNRTSVMLAVPGRIVPAAAAVAAQA